MAAQRPIVFLKTAWSRFYGKVSTPRGSDSPAGAHTWLKEHEGHEGRNFKDVGGYCYGYAPIQGRVDIRKHFGADVNAKYLDHVDVVWAAKHPKGGIRIVGWYRNARLYREWQGRLGRYYVTRALAKDCTLLSSDERDQKLPGSFRRAAIWYGNASALRAARDLISGSPMPAGQKGRVTQGRHVAKDVAFREQIERISVDAAEKYYAETKRLNVLSVERENKGWDLEISGRGLDPFFVEVKGTSLPIFSVDLTPHEYAQMLRLQEQYRVFIVTSALTKPQSIEFQLSEHGWADDSGLHALKIKPLTAARLTPSRPGRRLNSRG